MLRLCILFYAVDTVFISELATDLQISLDVFSKYYELWKLNVDIAKTKILVFSNGRMTHRRFLYNDKPIENAKSFCYLSIVMSNYENFNHAKKHLVEQASKALIVFFRKYAISSYQLFAK